MVGLDVTLHSLDSISERSCSLGLHRGLEGANRIDIYVHATYPLRLLDPVPLADLLEEYFYPGAFTFFIQITLSL